jgi:hypothetical protein
VASWRLKPHLFYNLVLLYLITIIIDQLICLLVTLAHFCFDHISG